MLRDVALVGAGLVGGWLAAKHRLGPNALPDVIDPETINVDELDDGGFEVTSSGIRIGELHPSGPADNHDFVWWATFIMPSGKRQGVIEGDDFDALVWRLVRQYPPRNQRS